MQDELVEMQALKSRQRAEDMRRFQPGQVTPKQLWRENSIGLLVSSKRMLKLRHRRVLGEDNPKTPRHPQDYLALLRQKKNSTENGRDFACLAPSIFTDLAPWYSKPHGQCLWNSAQ
jgi:hypothetical protein